MLRLLKRSNADTKTLNVVYITVIKPILEYACQVWHFNIQNFLSEDIERIQKCALKIIVPFSSYAWRGIKDYGYH
jgi:ABC-type transport system involved in cytochrome bd biosynthesis fused ATPase/permease subunit